MAYVFVYDSTTGKMVLDDVGTGGGDVSPLVIPWSGTSTPYKQTNSTTYTTVQRFIFPGTTDFGTPTAFRAIMHNAGPLTMDLRIVDETTAAVVAEVTGASNATPTIVTVPIIGVPVWTAGPAIFAVEQRRVGAGGGNWVRSSSLIVEV